MTKNERVEVSETAEDLLRLIGDIEEKHGSPQDWVTSLDNARTRLLNLIGEERLP